MHISSLAIKNFRCFGDESVVFDLEQGITALVGDNGAGKSASILALKRLFSPSRFERHVTKSDIHFGINEEPETVERREVFIDVTFETNKDAPAPQIFNDLFFDAGTETLKARIRLEALFESDKSLDDEIDIRIYAVRTAEDIDFGDDDARKARFVGIPTRLAELFYIPAHRDASGIMNHALKNLLSRLEKSADWKPETKEATAQIATKLEEKLSEEPAFQALHDSLSKEWKALHDSRFETELKLSVISTDFEQLLRALTLKFEPSPDGSKRPLEELSEGQLSLLYFSLTTTLQKLLWKLENENGGQGFLPPQKALPPLTLFALEEPENHLGPFYLPKLVEMLKGLCVSGRGQALLTSHSPGTLSRVEPQQVRYLRKCQKTLRSSVQKIPLPKGGDEQKFVNEVLKVNPELYFAKLIIFGEGDSERIVIPKIADALGLPLDPSFVAFLPLGGRHANHMWRLACQHRTKIRPNNGVKLGHFCAMTAQALHS